MNKPANILIVRTDKIGDVVLTLPVASIIKGFYPECRVTFMVQEYTRQLLAGNPSIDEIIVLHKKNGKIDYSKNLAEIKKRKFDTAITVFPSFKLARILFAAGINTRIGTGYRWYSFLFNKKVFEHRKYGTNHELVHNVNLLNKIGIEYTPEFGNVQFNIQIQSKAYNKVEQILNNSDYDPGKKTVIIHPGSGGSAVDLPIDRFRELVKILAQRLSVNIILTGLEQEKEICSYIASNKNVLNFAGLFNLSEMVALTNRCNLLVANSTGPIHIAAALDKWVIGFYPKIAACSPVRWGPFTKKRVIFSPTLGCSNCSRIQCAELNCMNSIEANDVALKIEEILKV